MHPTDPEEWLSRQGQWKRGIGSETTVGRHQGRSVSRSACKRFLHIRIWTCGSDWRGSNVSWVTFVCVSFCGRTSCIASSTRYGASLAWMLVTEADGLMFWAGRATDGQDPTSRILDTLCREVPIAQSVELGKPETFELRWLHGMLRRDTQSKRVVSSSRRISNRPRARNASEGVRRRSEEIAKTSRRHLTV